MSHNPYQRPQKPQSTPATNRPKPIQKSNQDRSRQDNSGGGNNRGNDGRGDRNPPKPSPWLNPDNEPIPDRATSFVEYLRWMREPDNKYKDGTKVQILQIAEDNAKNYRDRLQQLTQRTELIAGKNNTFTVECPWRIRVGGNKGPENILLPAFDALGMPYIPSSTLRGVARDRAIREIMTEKGVKWQDAEKQVAPYFGDLEVKNKGDRAGKVIFLDAYPLPSSSGGLKMDMANNIWKWDKNDLKYDPNPNPFLSLEKTSFLIGLRLASNCSEPKILDRVKQWLIDGLQAGIGSQVNTGYGELIKPGTRKPSEEFFRVEFALEGQLIHGRQKFTQWNWNDRRNEWQMRGQADAEVRPVAFKSMLRYWFRAFALGVLEIDRVREWEAKLFGAINPQQRGWVKFGILEGKVIQKEPKKNNEPCGEQEGILTLAYSSEAPEIQREAIASLFKNLTWMMFHLGGVGQGARRPCYSRTNRDRAPWYRGSSLFIESEASFWDLPATPKEFSQLFQKRLQAFYENLERLSKTKINSRLPKAVSQVTQEQWTEAVDKNCQIVVCSGQENYNKPHALAILHSQDLKINNNYDGNLCGRVAGVVKPSPVWIADLEDYQVVTIFGVDRDPRRKYLQLLRDRTSPQNYARIFPLP